MRKALALLLSALLASPALAQVYPYFPPPGLTYAQAPSTLSTPAPPSGNDGNPLNITASPGVGANHNGGGLTFTSGAADQTAGGTGQGGTLTFQAGANGLAFTGSLTPSIDFIADPFNTFTITPGPSTGASAPAWIFQNTSANTGTESVLYFWNDTADGPLLCTTEDNFNGTDAFCGIQNAVPAITPQRGSVIGCVSNLDCYIVWGSGPQPVVRITGGLWRFWGSNFSQVGTTSGEITFKTQAAAGTYNMNWPTTAGTAGQWLTSQGGGSTAMTWTGGELTGTSASIGGGALAAGACASTATTVTGAAVGNRVVVTPNTYPGDSAFWKGYVSGSNTVTVLICEAVAGTPTASTYNISVFK